MPGPKSILQSQRYCVSSIAQNELCKVERDANDTLRVAYQTPLWISNQERKDPRLLGHPMTKMRNWAQKAIPLSLHGDGVPVVKVGKPGSESFETYSMQSLWAKGSTMAVKMLLFGIFEAV